MGRVLVGLRERLANDLVIAAGGHGVNHRGAGDRAPAHVNPARATGRHSILDFRFWILD
jgi:hypothetical protein